jgi:hypothetical protein
MKSNRLLNVVRINKWRTGIGEGVEYHGASVIEGIDENKDC